MWVQYWWIRSKVRLARGWELSCIDGPHHTTDASIVILGKRNALCKTLPWDTTAKTTHALYIAEFSNRTYYAWKTPFNKLPNKCHSQLPTESNGGHIVYIYMCVRVCVCVCECVCIKLNIYIHRLMVRRVIIWIIQNINPYDHLAELLFLNIKILDRLIPKMAVNRIINSLRSI